MAASSRHAQGRRVPARTRHPARRLTALLTAAAASAAVVTAAAVVSPRDASLQTTAITRDAGKNTTAMAPPAGHAGRRPGPGQPPSASQAPPFPPTLTAFDRRSCPAAATACVDLTRHLSWLQSAGQVTFGPVQAEPGPPGTQHATPRGTFQVSWKAGANYISNIYKEPMPWAVFFAPGGIAFHGGSLTAPSHGCVHLTTQNALYYNEHLPVGAEVVVF